MPSDESQHASKAGGNPTDSNAPVLETVLETYLDKLAAGEEPDQEAYLREYPELADALRGVFKTLAFVEATSKSIYGTSLSPDQWLGEYRIVREVGRGGMGVVYEAIQTSLNRNVALKVLPPGAVLSPNAPERFLREAETAGKLHHTNIVPVYAVGEEEGIQYYAMQFIEGKSLAQCLKDMRESDIALTRDDMNQIARWGQQIADALAYAHQQGIIHRDIKPSNLLLDAQDNVWITDFGLARTNIHASITMTGDVVGTARYMSPEQAGGSRNPIDERSDIYSLGVTLYELLALNPAFDGESREEVLNRISHQSPQALRQLNPKIPRDLETIIIKCMEKQRTRRYERAVDVADDCRRFLAGDPIRARRTPIIVKAVRWINRHRFQTAAVLVTLLLILATMFFLYQIRHVRGEGLVAKGFDALLLERDSVHATALFEEAEQLGIDSAQLHLGQGLIYVLNIQPQRGLSPLLLSLQRDSDNVETRLAVAFAYLSLGDMTNGESYFHNIEQHEIKTPLGWLLRGHILKLMQDRTALDAYNHAIALQPNLSIAIEARAFLRADKLLVDGDRYELEGMLEDFDAWVRFWPDSYRSYTARAAGLMYAGAFGRTQPDLQEKSSDWFVQALVDLEHAFTLRPVKHAYLLAQRGSYHRYLGNFIQSEQDFREATRLDREAAGDEHPGFIHHHVLVLHILGELESALDILDLETDSTPTFFPLHLQHAVILAELGRSDQAKELCQQLLDEQQSSDTGLFLVADTLLLLGERETVQSAINSWATQHIDDEKYTEDMRRILQGKIDYMNGRINSDELIALTDGHPGVLCDCYFLIAVDELGQGHHQAGVEALLNCLDTGVFIYLQYRFAQVFLARAQEDPKWPKWIAEN